jgi:glycosyltransferase involved in cell wall biosynthesis
VIVSFVYPSSRQRAGGVTMIYEFANALARRGHDVHLLHGPATPWRVDRVDEIPFAFDPAVEHHIVDALDDPRLPAGDVVFGSPERRLGQPAALVQGFRLTAAWLDRATFHSVGPKVCVASWLVEVGRAYGVPEEQLVHVPMGLDHELFASRTPQDERTIDVAMLYHPSREKGWDVGRAVLHDLARRRPGLRAVVFSLAGAPPEPLPVGVEVRLDLGQAQLAEEVYNQTRVFVQTSHHEGFGLTALEAMACGAALVTTDCGGSRDYATPDVTAVVVRAGDVAGLSGAADALLEDADRRRALAMAGTSAAFAFDWGLSGELLEAVLQRYIADPGSFQHPPGEDRSEEYAL